MAFKKAARRRRASAQRGSRSYRSSRRSSKTTLPLAVLGGFAPYVVNTVNAFRTGGVDGLQRSVTYLVPFDPATRRFTTANLGGGLYPILAGLAVHKVVGGMLGVNRLLARMNVPFIRI